MYGGHPHGHRGPAHQPPNQPVGGFTPIGEGRVADLLEQVRADYSAVVSDYDSQKMQKEEFERKLGEQLNEFSSFKQTILDLENKHMSVKQRYEDQIHQLKQKIDQLQSQLQQQSQQGRDVGALQPPMGMHDRSDSTSPGPFVRRSNPKAPQEINENENMGGQENYNSYPSRPFPPMNMTTQFITNNFIQPDIKRYESFGVPSLGEMDNNRQGPKETDMSPKPPQHQQPGLFNASSGSGAPNNSQPRANNNRMTNLISNLTDSQSPNDLAPQFPKQNQPTGSNSSNMNNNQSNNNNNQNNNQNNGNNNATNNNNNLNNQQLAIPNGKIGGGDPNMVKREGNDWLVVYNPSVKANATISLLHNMDHQQSVVCCVRFSADGKYLATGSNKMAQVFDVETGKKVLSFPSEEASNDDDNHHQDHDADKSNDRASGDNNTANNTNNDQDDPMNANLGIAGPEKEDSYVRSVCFSPDGKYLVAGTEDRTVKVWDINSGDLKYSLGGHELDIYSLDYSYDNRFVVSGSGDGKAKIWNMENGMCEHTLGNDEIGPKEGVTSVAISPDGRVVAAGSLDCVVRLWDTMTGKFLDSFKGHDDSVYSVAFSPDGKTLASGSLDRTLKLWDLNGGGSVTGGGDRAYSRCIGTLSGHRDYVLSVAFSNDGKWLISGSKDRSVQFWDPRSNVLHMMMQGHKNSVISVALNPTKHMFATGSGDFRARIWAVNDNV
ncbi:general transcriptional corepressor TUP1 [Acrasis kona]|uniref:General transcriptional corepressor TUP1 n=1 Tax=Acrasis kona TaxID=1008807 RepID=A0AAW2ZSD2_9EUKA